MLKKIKDFVPVKHDEQNAEPDTPQSLARAYDRSKLPWNGVIQSSGQGGSGKIWQ